MCPKKDMYKEHYQLRCIRCGVVPGVLLLGRPVTTGNVEVSGQWPLKLTAGWHNNLMIPIPDSHVSHLSLVTNRHEDNSVPPVPDVMFCLEYYGPGNQLLTMLHGRDQTFHLYTPIQKLQGGCLKKVCFALTKHSDVTFTAMLGSLGQRTPHGSRHLNPQLQGMNYADNCYTSTGNPNSIKGA